MKGSTGVLSEMEEDKKIGARRKIGKASGCVSKRVSTMSTGLLLLAIIINYEYLRQVIIALDG